MMELFGAGAGCGPYLLAQDDYGGIVSLVILAIIAIASAIAESRRKKSGKSPDAVARQEQQQYKQRATEARQGQISRAAGQVDEKRSGYHGRAEVVPKRAVGQQAQQPQRRPQPADGRQRTLQQQQQQRLTQRQQSMAGGGRQPSYVSADELRQAERKAAERVRLMSQRPQKTAAQGPMMKMPPMHAAAGSITLDEIGSQRRQQAIDAISAQRSLAQKTAHMTELQRGFIYHEIFSAPRAIRSDVSVWDT